MKMKCVVALDFPKNIPGKEELNLALPCGEDIFTIIVGEKQETNEAFEMAFRVRGKPDVKGVWAYSSEHGVGCFLLTGEQIWIQMPNGFCEDCVNEAFDTFEVVSKFAM